ncbi:MAG: acyl carrier protein [Bacteroidaceae bacterium]|nr:acyl carrier protein [Bacteroidaceae bacterium]
MELQELINLFEEVLNKEGKETIAADTNFKDCEHWDSLSAFTISETIYDKWNVKLRGIQIRKCSTIKDLFDLISAN